MDSRGHSLVELLVALSITLGLLVVATPHVRAFAVQVRILETGRVFKAEFLKARSIAVRSSVQTAIRFERGPDGTWSYSLYMDGNRNGVLTADIRSGADTRVSNPIPLEGRAGVRVAILPGIPAIPPERGTLDPTDPIRFGRSDMLSFSPEGTATPGTFYLAGEGGIQAAVRVNAMTSRVRLMVYQAGRWKEEP